MAGKYSVETVFGAKDKTIPVVDRIERRLERFARATKTRFDGLREGPEIMYRGLMDVGRAALGASAALGFLVKDFAEVGAAFEQALVNATVKFDGAVRRGTPTFELMSDAAKKIGETTEFSAKQAADSLGFLAAAGFNAQQTLAALPQVVDFATAAEMELADAGNAAADSLGAFGLFAKDSTQLSVNLARITDSLAKGADLSNVSLIDLYETAKNAAPAFTAAGVSVETFTAMASVMAKAGVKGADAGTSLKNAMIRLSAPPTEAAKALKKLGIVTADASGKLRDPVLILADLEKALAKTTKVKGTGYLSDIFGMHALPGMLALVNQGSAEIEQFRAQIEGAAGATAAKATVMRNTTQGMIKRLGNMYEGLKIQAFEAMQAPLERGLNSLMEFSAAHKDAVAKGLGEFVTYIVDHSDTIWTWGRRLAYAALALKGWLIALSIGKGVIDTARGAVFLCTTAVQAYQVAAKAAAYANGIWTIANWATAGSLRAVAVGAGAVGAAIGSILIAVDQFTKLLDVLQGYDSWTLLLDFAKGDYEGGFRKLDDYQNKLAKQDAQERASQRPAAEREGAATADLDAALARVDAMIADAQGGVGSAGAAAQAAGGAVEPALASASARVRTGSTISDADAARFVLDTARSSMRPGVAVAGGKPAEAVVAGEIVIRDETGRAQVKQPPKSSAVPLRLAPSGAF